MQVKGDLGKNAFSVLDIRNYAKFVVPITVKIFRVTVVLKILFLLNASAVTLKAIEKSHMAK